MTHSHSRRQQALGITSALALVLAGAALARQAIADGADVLIPGEMGIGNTTPAAATVMAWRTTVFGTVRWPTLVSSRPRNSAAIAASSTIAVVTLIPPAVPAEPPPTNISASETSKVIGVDSFVSVSANPPERIMTEANSAWNAFSAGFRWPMVRSLPHSSRP